MNHFSSWLSSPAVQALGWTLVHFIWQGALVALLLPLLAAFLRTANSRYAAGLGILGLMTAAPVITFFVLLPASSSTVAVPVFFHRAVLNSGAAPALTATNAFPVYGVAFDWLRVSVLLWLTGIVVLSLRTLGGWYVMERMRRRKTQLTGSLRVACLQLQERMGIRRTVSYCQSYLTHAPSVIGWFRPVVLLPASALTGLSASQIETIIAHELAHIRRFDAFVNLFQIAAETVLFYHPGVWWVSRRLRMERENCCDDMAVSVCGNPLEYAKALTLMEAWRTAPTLALAANGGSLKARVSRLLGLQTFATGMPRIGIAVLVLVVSGGVLLASGRLTGDLGQTRSISDCDADLHAPAPPPPPAVPEPYTQPEPATPVILVALSAAAAPEPVIAPGKGWARAQEPPTPATPPAAPDSAAAPAAPIAPPAPSAPPPAPAAPAEPAPPAAPPPAGGHSSYIDGMAAAGYNNMSVDDLIAMKIQGITPEYARDMRASGLSFSRSELIEMKIQGVTPEYVRHIRETWKDVTARELVEMRIQGVQPSDVNQFRQLGMSDVSVHNLIEMKIQGVTPEYARRIRATWKDATVHDLIELRIQGVDPDEVSQFRQLGLGDVTLQKLVEMKIQGVTPDYVRQMKDAGFTGTAREYVNVKVLGITPEFVRMVHSHGFTDLSAHKLIQFKLAGIF